MSNENNSVSQETEIGETKLKKILLEKRMMQKDLAKLANVEVYQISQIASGKKTNIMLDTAKRICNALNKTLDEVFGDD
ncbi:MAG TPA: helix-turn-helix transcriptional regulator [Bacteroidia bacterium]|jgi:transcriptional regulator with XRE-family HTH domain|nr:helix-turn-helix transcriptional regulator [Bacteroidia bacterium]